MSKLIKGLNLITLILEALEISELRKIKKQIVSDTAYQNDNTKRLSTRIYSWKKNRRKIIVIFLREDLISF